MAAPPRALAKRELQSINPATLEVVGAVRAAAPEEVPEAVAEARFVQIRWAASPHDAFEGALGVLYAQGLGAKAGAAWRHRHGLSHLARRYLGFA